MAERKRREISRRAFLRGAALGFGATASDLSFLASLAGATENPITTENQQPGADPAEWFLTRDWLDDSIEGYAADFSVNAGETAHFKVKTDAPNWETRVYRLGWYGGLGARRLASWTTAGPAPQPAPLLDNSTGLVDCGNWATTTSWDVPSGAVSGVYVAIFKRLDSGAENQAWFVVRNDGRASDVLVQTSDTTWQAYNQWGGSSFYGLFGGPASSPWGRAVKLSYDRPFLPTGPEHSFYWAEYPLVRWLERNGYDVSYVAGLDAHRNGSHLLPRRVVVSSGHDEYWSGAQRTNFEAARDAGVSLVFMSGNEVYWKVRWEPSIATGSPDKTLVCYKETQDGAKTDPNPAWTGTWRDRRFSPPSDGGRPENELTGTLFKVINPVVDFDFALEVPYAYSRRRMWRNTDIASLAPGETATLANSTLGYEWDVDADNGSRPGGLVRFSETTKTGFEVLQDEGLVYLQAPATHHLTMYRAPSGALVWGLGTVQWAWGLDEFHETRPEEAVPADVRMQQATLNVLADMGAQPATRQGGLAPAAPSTDTVPPTTTFTAPAPATTVPIGSPVVATGMTVDSGGGEVAAVEVSTDGGTTWRLATGTGSWSIAFTPTALGPLTVLARAIDDSCNIESPASLALTAGPRAAPCSIWPAGATPTLVDSGDGSAVEVGVRFRAAEDGYITAARFYKAPTNGGAHVAHIWRTDRTLLGTAAFAAETASGWQQVSFPDPVPVQGGTTYIASVHMPAGHYSVDRGYFASAFDLPPMRALASGEDGPNGVFRYGSPGFPADTFGASNYWVDVVYDHDNHRAPTVVDRSPAPGLEAVATSAPITATFSEFMETDGAFFTVTRAGGLAVAGATTFDAAARTATFTPTDSLEPLGEYSVTVIGTDRHGEVSDPVTWSFTTVGPAGSYPATLWDSSFGPTTAPGSEPSELELGVRFFADIDVLVTAVRFYKATGNDGTHVGRLWRSDGALLGSVAFTGETATGWQQANFAEPIRVPQGAVHVVSYHSLTGVYSRTPGGLNAGRDRGGLHAPRSTQGGNGVYSYGPASLPTQTFEATNYWVDLVVVPAPDIAAPTILDRSPAPGIVAVAATATVTVKFDEPVNPASAQLELSGPSGPVAGTSLYDGPSRTVTFTPSSPLATGTVFTATLAPAADLAGNAMAAPVSWSFTTAHLVGSTPATIWDTSAEPAVSAAADANAVEVGLKFRSDLDGMLTGLRFYKGSGNSGTHIGHVWTTGGILLGSVTFTAETATGWQQANFSSPVPIAAGVTYLASYHAPNGRYSTTSGGFTAGVDRAPLHALASGAAGGNGVFAYGPGSFPSSTFGATNYWVDVVFQDTAAPAVLDRSPAPGATAVPTATTASATFNEAVVASSAAIELRDGLGAVVPGANSYAAATRTVTFDPSSNLLQQKPYTATVAGATDLAGNPMPPVSWSFTTADETGPLLVSRTPASAATGVPRATTVTATFDEDVQPATIVLTLSGPGGPVAATVSYASSTRTATLTPAAALANQSSYTATLSGVRDLVGNVGAPTSWSFTTADEVAPVITARTPSPGASGVSRTTNLTATFSEPVQASTIVFELRDPANALVPGTVSYSTANRRATLNPTPTLAYLTTYTATVSGARDAAGNPVAPTSWSFTTIPDTVAPTVSSRSPSPGAVSVSRNVNVTATFSEAVQPSTIVFQLRGPGGALVPAVVSYNEGNRRATLNPNATLLATTSYTATVSGAMDLAGNPMTSVSWAFTTGS